MQEPTRPKFYHKLFEPLEPGKVITRSQMIYFFGLLGISTVITKNTAPIQSCKIFFLAVTVHFFLNFFYAFECKTELEVFRKRHYSLLLAVCLSLGAIFGVNNPGYFFVVLNIPFFLALLASVAKSNDRKWKILMIVLNAALIVYFACFSPGNVMAQNSSQETVESTNEITTGQTIIAVKAQRFFYTNWSILLLVLIAIALYVAVSHYDKPHENVFHLGNLINFFLVSFLPFLFVLQKDIVPPMTNWLGYILLIPNVLSLSMAIGLGYFFLANMKDFQIYSFVNLLIIYYLFISCDLFGCFLGQISSFVVLLIFGLNFPLKNFTVMVESYYGTEGVEENLENYKPGEGKEEDSNAYSYNNKSKFLKVFNDNIIFFIIIFFKLNLFRLYTNSHLKNYFLKRK